ncbi:DUF1428 domain-containing protein [Exilibacterium tricleocarpae]|uniref:DUF1428 domain-containing protein n=1 Tax=Exilibacterium tricleocarpae TaxID=2591008 RepID=A0A545SL50_9GAMM|nr:DUF1428 domain-containing protein [Exilibacterium tricleocarpae]TQV65682.1 DUF1428 domain-containing protein [Exilibacterium tricleocarpae]
MSYVDGYVIAVPTAEKETYIKLAEEAAVVFKAHGAVSVVENWGNDVPEGKITSFPMAVKCTDKETVVFSWITWPSKEVRDTGMQGAMEDPRMKSMGPDAVPFDGKRMIFGGFETIVEK